MAEAAPWEENHTAPSADAPPWESSSTPTQPAKRGVIDKLLGFSGPRYQTFPERAVRGLVEAPKALIDAAASAPPGSRQLTENLIAPSTEAALAFSPMGPESRLAKAAGKGVRMEAPTQEELAAEAVTKGYKGGVMDVPLKEHVLPEIQTNILDHLHAEHYRDYGAPFVFRAVKELEPVKGKIPTVADIETVRQILSKAPFDQRAAASTARNKINEYLSELQQNDVGIEGPILYQGVRSTKVGGLSKGSPQRSEYWTTNLNMAKDYAGPDGFIRVSKWDHFPEEAKVRGIDGRGVASSLKLGEAGNPATIQQVHEIGQIDSSAPAEAFNSIIEGELEKNVGKILTAIRGNYSKLKQSEMITTGAEDAARGAQSSGMGANLDNKLRQLLKSIRKNPKSMSGISKEVTKEMDKVIKGGAITNLARMVSRFGPQHPLTGWGIAGIEGIKHGAVLPMMTLAIGHAAQKIAEHSTKKGLRKIDEMIRRESPLYRERGGKVPKPPASAADDPTLSALTRGLFAAGPPGTTFVPMPGTPAPGGYYSPNSDVKSYLDKSGL